MRLIKYSRTSFHMRSIYFIFAKSLEEKRKKQSLPSDSDKERGVEIPSVR